MKYLYVLTILLVLLCGDIHIPLNGDVSNTQSEISVAVNNSINLTKEIVQTDSYVVNETANIAYSLVFEIYDDSMYLSNITMQSVLSINPQPACDGTDNLTYTLINKKTNLDCKEW